MTTEAARQEKFFRELPHCVQETTRFILQKQRELEENRSLTWSKNILRRQ